MKKNQKYDQSYHSVKSKVLYVWLKKTFSKLSLDETKQILYDLESSMDNEDVESNQEKRNNTSDDSGSDNELESGDENIEEAAEGPSSSDMFKESSESDMDTDVELTSYDKDRLIHSYVTNMDKNILLNEDKVPEVVKKSVTYKKKKEEYILQFVDNLFDSSNSQDIAVNYSQLPEFVKSNPYLDIKLSHHKKK